MKVIVTIISSLAIVSAGGGYFSNGGSFPYHSSGNYAGAVSSAHSSGFGGSMFRHHSAGHRSFAVKPSVLYLPPKTSHGSFTHGHGGSYGGGNADYIWPKESVSFGKAYDFGSAGGWAGKSAKRNGGFGDSGFYRGPSGMSAWSGKSSNRFGGAESLTGRFSGNIEGTNRWAKKSSFGSGNSGRWVDKSAGNFGGHGGYVSHGGVGWAGQSGRGFSTSGSSSASSAAGWWK